GTDTSPMWAEGGSGRMFFVSDRPEDKDGNYSTRNLFELNPDTLAATQLTRHADYDVLWPSYGAGAIVYQHGGDLRGDDVASREDRVGPIEIPDDAMGSRAHWENVSDKVSSVSISPSGKRAAVVARGDVFSVPAAKGEWRNLTRTPGARESFAAWSPDGKTIAYVSDASGEDEIYLLAQDGSSPPRRITDDGSITRFQPIWSPDSKKLVWTDKANQIWYLDASETSAPI